MKLPSQWIPSLIRLFLVSFLWFGNSVIGEESPQPSRIKDFGLKPYLHVSKQLPHREDQPWKLVCTLPYNAQFQPGLKATGPAGRTISFNSSNPLVQYLTPTETTTTEQGSRLYEAKNWVSGEGAIYTIPAGVTVETVQYRETGYDTRLLGEFECSEPDFNILWKKAARTCYLCMRDHFYDCPDRERVGFWGDGTPELNQCFYLFDRNSHQLCKELVLRKLEPKFYPGQHLEFLGEYGLWFYYLHTGDLDSIREVYAQTREFLLTTYVSGNHRTWYDWGKENKDTAVIEACFLYIDLKTLVKVAKITGHDVDIPEIEDRIRQIESTFNARFWRGRYYQSDQVQEPDDRANAMAVNAGLADRSKWPSIFENVLTQKEYSSCFFDRWIFEALCTMRKEEFALRRMQRRYQTMIPCSFTTLWEHYDRWWASQVDAFDEGSSLNHGWNPPALLLSQTISGISPETPGWRRFHVLPKEAFLTSIHCVVPTVAGMVTVDLHKDSSEYRLDVSVPKGTTAIIGLPKHSFSSLKRIQVNKNTVWDGSFRTGEQGIGWAGEDESYVKFSVPEGTWKLVGEGRLTVEPTTSSPIKETDEAALDKSRWKASASVQDGTFPFSGDNIPIDVSAANAVDGDHWNGWRDMTRLQYPGQWFQVDLGQVETFDSLVLDNTWALWDSPTEYTVMVSNDGVHWSQPVAHGKGALGITRATFPTQTARHVRVTQTGKSDKYHWSIYELDLYRTLSEGRSMPRTAHPGAGN
jgi:alpha-L-rhamnosidase